jgi:hypothetical protein
MSRKFANASRRALSSKRHPKRGFFVIETGAHRFVVIAAQKGDTKNDNERCGPMAMPRTQSAAEADEPAAADFPSHFRMRELVDRLG